MATDDLRHTLERVGDRFDLGEYEIDAYLAVLEHGQLTASEIAERTEIPQPRVYDTVRGLSDRGLVELRESRPMKIVGVDPSEAFEDVQESLSTMIEQLQTRYTAPARETEAVTLVKSRSTILRYLEEVIEAAEHELTLSLSPDLLARFEDRLREKAAPDRTVELLLSPAAEVPGDFDYESVATEVRTRRGTTTPVIAVADGEYSIYATRDALREDRDRYGVIFNRSELGFLVSAFFWTVLWTTPESVLLSDGEGRTLPHRYASVRRCVKDLRDLEGPFFATVEGRDVETGRDRVVRGEVVETTFEDSEEVASLTIAAEDGEVTVGGRVAALEDVEAHAIHVGRDAPPE